MDNQIKCRCLYFDGTCHHCGNTPQETESQRVKRIWDSGKDFDKVRMFPDNPQEVPQVKSVRPTAREYLKSKGLKNPPLDSGISGGGDAPRRYASDMMDEWNNLNGKFRDKALFVAELRIAELEADLNTTNKRIDHYRTEVSKIRCFTFDSNNNIGQPGQNIFEAIQQTIDELEKQNAVYREALEKIKNTSYDSEENKDVWHDEIAEQALNSKEVGNG